MADYAISNVPRRVVYAASGVGPYAFTFEILDQTDISVYKASTLLTLTTDYTVTINANGTGSVTLVTTAGTSNITIVGAKNIQRTSDFTTGGDLFANTLNDELDNQTIFIQQVAETAERGLKAPVTDPTDIAMTLPDKSSRAGKVLAFDSTTGNPVAGPALDSVTTVIEQSANINTVAENIADVIIVADDISDVNTVAGIAGNVSTVAGSISNVNTVANDLNEGTSEINTVAVNIDNVNEVGNYIANVNSVAANTSNINAVAGNSTNINAVAGNATNINAVNANSTNINTVATNIANVNTVGSNIANVNQVAADTVVINSASANATSAANSANAASASATSASASAAAASAVALGNEPVRHSVRPSLLLDFANTKTLDPRITFTRGSTATFYDGKTVAKAEENLILQSQQLNLWSINAGLTLTGNATTSPDGTTTATLAVPTNTSQTGRRLFNNTVTLTASTSVFSLYVKASGYTKVAVREGLGGYYAAFDLASSGSVIASASCTPAITSIGSGWFRITLTATATAGGNLFSIFPLDNAYTTGSPSSYTFTGDGTSGVFLWGAQLEQRSSVTAYTATTTAPITNYIPALQTAAANVARFEHNPVTGESLGLEIEEQRTNLFTYSEDLSNAAWLTNASSVTVNAATAPSGSVTANRLVENTATTAHSLRQSITKAASAIQYTYSVYLKAETRTFAYLLMQDGAGNGAQVYFNLTTGAISTAASLIGSGFSGHSATITPVGNGWHRCTLTVTSNTATTLISYVTLSTDGSTNSYTGNGFSGIFVWGAQLEAGSFATSYIPTVASQVTRSADSASMTGTNFSSWYRADEGTLYGDFVKASSATNFLYGLGYSGTNYIGVAYQSGGGSVIVAPLTGALTVGGIVGGTSYKQAVSYSSTGASTSLNGATTVTAAASGALMTGTTGTLYFGTSPFQPSVIASGYFKKLAYYPKRLTSAELQSLTTI